MCFAQSCTSQAFGSHSCEPVLLPRMLPISAFLNLACLCSAPAALSAVPTHQSEHMGNKFAQGFEMGSLPGTWAHL